MGLQDGVIHQRFKVSVILGIASIADCITETILFQQ